MRTEILMPKLGLTMTQGTVMEWMKKTGDSVLKGEILFTVENDKAIVEVESPAEGVLEEILIHAGATQEVGKVVAYLSSPGSSRKESQESWQQEAILKDPIGTSDTYIPASPLAKRLARVNRIDLSNVRGTGPEGAIVERDLASFVFSQEDFPQEALSQAASSSAILSQPTTLHTLSPIQIRIAERMVQSWTTIPQFSLWVDVEADSLLSLHQALKERGSSVSFTVLLAKFLAITLEQYPMLNASWQGQGEVEVFPQVHVGIATDTSAGLLVPVLRDCRTKPLKALQEEWKEISTRAREGKLSLTDLSGGTITLTNLGMYGVKRFQAIVNPPQVAILSVGEVLRRPKEGASSAFVSVIEFGLSADHRVVDGAYGARFLKSFKDAIESPLLTLANRV